MTPFLQFRIWYRRASAVQKGSGLVAVLVARVVWTAVPSTNSGSSVGVAGGNGPSGGASSGAGSTDHTGAMPFPLGPNNFSVPGTTWGGQFCRPLNYSGVCQRWKVTNPVWNPSFQ